MPSISYSDTPYAEKKRLFQAVQSDPRYSQYLHGCYECGICVAACPSARFYDFSPRKIAQVLAREDIEWFYEQLNDDIWNCSQCFSCLRCPRGNNPGGLITIMREVAVTNGLSSMKQALEGYTRVVYKIMTTGVQVTPDMLQPDAFPDWGPQVQEVASNLDLWRHAMPVETMRTTSLAWQVDPHTQLELYAIWKLTGALDMMQAVDETLFELMDEMMEEALDDSDIVL